jgi:hypothetical protein
LGGAIQSSISTPSLSARHTHAEIRVSFFLKKEDGPTAAITRTLGELHDEGATAGKGGGARPTDNRLTIHQ